MTVPIWLAITGGVGVIIGSGGLGAVLVALIQGRNGLPAHLNTELRRLSEENARAQQRLDSLESHQVIMGDHVDLLENHIWKQLPPPPPPRPIFRPTPRSESE